MPPAELVAEWTKEAAIYARNYSEWAGMTWERYVEQVMSPLRQVALAPFLIAVRGAPKSHPTGAAERESIAVEGFRLPTADEWEFACSAGSRSAWHWGDDPTGGPPEANAFGLDIVRNTYVLEPLHEPRHYRGGDGGQREHGGACDLEGFVPQSSWFGSRRNPDLADPRLEALRRLAVIAWHRGYAIATAEIRAFKQAGFTMAQYELVLASISRGRDALNQRVH